MQDVRITMSSSRFSIFPTIPTVKSLRPKKDCGENLLTCISVDSDKVSLSSYVLSLAVVVAPLESAVVVVRWGRAKMKVSLGLKVAKPIEDVQASQNQPVHQSDH